MNTTPRKEYKPLQPGEPFFWLRGKDVLSPVGLQAYALACRSAAAGVASQGNHERAAELREHAAAVEQVAAETMAWQAAHPELVGLPD